MHLSKVYCDCITPEGHAFIGYAASLRAGGLTIPWSASRLWTDRADTRCGFFRHVTTDSGRDLSLRLPRQGVEGLWQGSEPCPELTLSEEHGVRIRWRVLRPRASVRLRVRDRVCHGLGYAERLDMSFSRPKLPFRELHWGRFLPDQGDGYLIWIGWRNGLERSWVLDSSGSVARRADMSDRHLEYAGGALRLTRVRSLTLDPISVHFPAWVNKTLGRGLAEGRECKYLARGEWTGPDGSLRQGWALHEVVRW